MGPLTKTTVIDLSNNPVSGTELEGEVDIYEKVQNIKCDKKGQTFGVQH